MSVSRKLNALLFELQTARTPLARAKILARSWRTLRELSPTDRRLLARQAGFEGAEELLEGLARRKGGWGPAMLLELLGNARSTDASTVSQILRGLQTPGARKDALRRGADLAAELLTVHEGLEAAKEEEPAEHGVEPPEPELAMEAEPSAQVEVPDAVQSLEKSEDAEEGDAEVVDIAQSAAEVEPSAEVPHEEEVEPEPEPPPAPKPPSPPPVDWSHWNLASVPFSVEAAAGATMAAKEAPARPAAGSAAERFTSERKSNTLALLSSLHRELPALKGAGLEGLREVLSELPEGWARRRAVSAMLEAGIPADPRQAVELIAGLERELDRRWCLGTLAGRGDLRGADLDWALELLSSPSARRRVRRAAENRAVGDQASG